VLHFVRALAVVLLLRGPAWGQNVPAVVTWQAPTTGTVSSSATIVATPGGKATTVCNTTASGGGNIWLNPNGGTAVVGAGHEAGVAQSSTAMGGCVVYGTPLAHPITGVCDSGTCSYTVTRGN
jgi:hypothetical protein